MRFSDLYSGKLQAVCTAALGLYLSTSEYAFPFSLFTFAISRTDSLHKMLMQQHNSSVLLENFWAHYHKNTITRFLLYSGGVSGSTWACSLLLCSLQWRGGDGNLSEGICFRLVYQYVLLQLKRPVPITLQVKSVWRKHSKMEKKKNTYFFKILI